MCFCFAQGFTDPGFESYSVSAGQFSRPDTGPWTFVNDAAVVRPYAGNSSLGPLSTWSATFTAPEGQQYASTYAGLDSIVQTVTFSTPGQYRISAVAAAPSGSVMVPPATQPGPLVQGSFYFILAGAQIGSTHTLDPGTTWQPYSAQFVISQPGDYSLGVRNAGAASYFINYDNFSIQVVPEPAMGTLCVLGIAVGGFVWRKLRKPLSKSSTVPEHTH